MPRPLLACLFVFVLAGGAVAGVVNLRRIGPALGLTGNGHQLHPAGRITTVGNFPTGRAVLPGRFLWVTYCGHGKDDVEVVDLTVGTVILTLRLPGCYGGITFSADGRHAYVNGTPQGSSPTGGPVKGAQGDVVHIFTVSRSTGRGVEGTPLALPATTGGTGRKDWISTASGVGSEQPEGIAVSPEGRRLVVALKHGRRRRRHRPAQSQINGRRCRPLPDGVAFDPGATSTSPTSTTARSRSSTPRPQGSPTRSTDSAASLAISPHTRRASLPTPGGARST